MQPYPPADYTRLDRVAQDVADLLHMGTISSESAGADGENFRKVKRWFANILLDLQSRPWRWWFLENVASTTLSSGQDLVDLKGHLDKVDAIYCFKWLKPRPLEAIVALRAEALACSRPNAGKPEFYALEAGRRMHLFPCPDASTPFTVIYQRPMHIALVPQDWEPLLVNGVLGRYGRHFDREQLSQDPAFFEARYEKQIKLARVSSHDAETALRWDSCARATATVTAASATDTATEFLVPASVSGVGNELVLNDGDFLVVQPADAEQPADYYIEVAG